MRGLGGIGRPNELHCACGFAERTTGIVVSPRQAACREKDAEDSAVFWCLTGRFWVRFFCVRDQHCGHWNLPKLMIDGPNLFAAPLSEVRGAARTCFRDRAWGMKKVVRLAGFGLDFGWGRPFALIHLRPVFIGQNAPPGKSHYEAKCVVHENILSEIVRASSAFARMPSHRTAPPTRPRQLLAGTSARAWTV